LAELAPRIEWKTCDALPSEFHRIRSICPFCKCKLRDWIHSQNTQRITPWP